MEGVTVRVTEVRYVGVRELGCGFLAFLSCVGDPERAEF